MDPALHASRILSRIQSIDWSKIDEKLPEDEARKAEFEKREGTTTAGTTPEPKPHDPNVGYGGNWGQSTGNGFGPPIS